MTTGFQTDIRQGTREDAVWYSCGANATHGKPRSSSDKRRAVETALRHPHVVTSIEEGKTISDRFIADHCGVGYMLVADVRANMEAPGARTGTSPQVRTGKDGKEYRQNQRQKYEAMAKEVNKARTEKARATKAANRAAAKAAEQAPSSTADENESGLNFAPAPPPTDAKPANPYTQGPGAAEIYVPAPAPKQSAPAPSYDQVMAMLEPGLRAAWARARADSSWITLGRFPPLGFGLAASSHAVLGRPPFSPATFCFSAAASA